MKIKIKYNGTYPNLCSGELVVIIDNVEWIFPEYCLASGGDATYHNNYGTVITRGPWSISKYPKNFPDNLRSVVEDAVNDSIPQGCCGGCI